MTTLNHRQQFMQGAAAEGGDGLLDDGGDYFRQYDRECAAGEPARQQHLGRLQALVSLVRDWPPEARRGLTSDHLRERDKLLDQLAEALSPYLAAEGRRR